MVQHTQSHVPEKVRQELINLLNSLQESLQTADLRDRVFEFLIANVGKPVTGEELRYVA